MGSGASVNTFFGLATMLISIPTGVKLFNWLFTIYQGRLRFTAPVCWTLGFMITFSIGGMTGVLLAVPGADFVLHNSLFVIAHFHNVIIGGAVFGYIAGFALLVPESLRFHPEREVGQSGLLVLDLRLLRGIHATVRAGLHGYDPSSEQLDQPCLGTVPVSCRGRCGADPVRYRLPTDPAVRFDP